MSTFFATQNPRNPEKITLPLRGPTNKRQAPVQLSSGGRTVAHASVSVPPEIALPCGAGEHINDAAAQVRLPSVSHLIAGVEASIAGQLRRDIPKPILQRIVIQCHSLVSGNSQGNITTIIEGPQVCELDPDMRPLNAFT
ncbi:hypothetical protein C0995_015007 [Termitomyces sp. Mi166|nr:hypothetical protein C0995_015007 [Termitomyces sp. Mi166\